MQAGEKKKMSQGKLVRNIAILVAMTIALVAPAGAQTWQSLGKTATIPVVVENTAFHSSTDTVGITADRKVLLSCQSGVWAKQAVGGMVSFRFSFPYPYDTAAHSGLPGEPPDGLSWRIGTGSYNSATGKFNGTLTCTVDGCGKNGLKDCGTVVDGDFYGGGCAAMHSAYTSFYTVKVKNLPVINVTQLW